MKRAKEVTVTPELVDVLNAAVAQAAKAEADARAARLEAERALNLARGTGDVQVQAAEAVRAVRAETIADRIAAVLAGPDAPMTFTALVRAVRASAGKVSIAMRAMRKANRVYNLGTEDHPSWIWIIGDEGTTAELNAHVLRLIMLQPMTMAQLMAATGARRGRVSGALVDMQKNHAGRWQNLGDNRTYRWFVPPVVAS